MVCANILCRAHIDIVKFRVLQRGVGRRWRRRLDTLKAYRVASIKPFARACTDRCRRTYSATPRPRRQFGSPGRRGVGGRSRGRCGRREGGAARHAAAAMLRAAQAPASQGLPRHRHGHAVRGKELLLSLFTVYIYILSFCLRVTIRLQRHDHV